jgi:hypothetical protein
MWIQKISSIKIAPVHLIGSSILFLLSISIIFIIDHQYQKDNKKALAVGLRADQSIKHYHEASEKRLNQILWLAFSKKQDYPKIKHYQEVKQEMLELHKLYEQTAEALLPLPTSYINQKTANRLDVVDLEAKKQKLFKGIYRCWQDYIIEHKASTEYSNKYHSGLVYSLLTQKPFRKIVNAFSFQNLKQLSRAQAYWQLKLQQLEIIAQLDKIEKEFVYAFNLDQDPYNYRVQSRNQRLAVPLGEALNLKADLLRTLPLTDLKLKVNHPDYKLVEENGKYFLEKKMDQKGQFKEAVQIEYNNPMTGEKEVQDLDLNYYIHP